jgi:DnaJ-class molecular chaperone
MGEAEARRVLGVSNDATGSEIQAAYRRLMSRAHPDAGGSEGLAERLNAARDRLLKR